MIQHEGSIRLMSIEEKQDVADIVLVHLGGNRGCLEFFIKAVLDQRPVIASLMIPLQEELTR